MKQTLRSRARALDLKGDTARLALLAREGTELDRDDFARVLGVAPPTVARWELGVARPNDTELMLLRAIAADPEVCLRLIEGQRAS